MKTTALHALLLGFTAIPAPCRYRASLPGGKSVYILRSEPSKEGRPDFLKGRIRVTTLQNQQETMDAGGLVLTKHPVFIEPLE